MALTKAQLEALKNSLLASQQPIIASTHRELIQNIIDEMYDAQSRGNLLAGVQIDGTTTTGDTLVLIRSGQAYLVPTSLFTEVAGDFVTRNTTQTITGAKTFENELVRIEGINPEIRLRASSNKSAVKFRTLTNQDNGEISYDDSEKKLKIETRGDNADIVIAPNGTGKVNLPNIPNGTGESLMRDTNGNIVKGAGGGGISDAPNNELRYVRRNLSWRNTLLDTFTLTTSGSLTLTDSNSNVTYTTTYNSLTVLTHQLINIKIYNINLLGIESTGSPSGGDFRITMVGDSTFADLVTDNSKITPKLTRIVGTSYTDSEISLISIQVATVNDGIVTVRFRKINSESSLPAFTSTSGKMNFTLITYN